MELFRQTFEEEPKEVKTVIRGSKLNVWVELTKLPVTTPFDIT
jgi:hypothetical protein